MKKIIKIVFAIFTIIFCLQIKVFADDTETYDDYSFYITTEKGVCYAYNSDPDDLNGSVYPLTVSYIKETDSYKLFFYGPMILKINSSKKINGNYTSLYSNRNIDLTANGNYYVTIKADSPENYDANSTLYSVYLNNDTNPTNFNAFTVNFYSNFDDSLFTSDNNLSLGCLYIKHGNYQPSSFYLSSTHTINTPLIQIDNGDIDVTGNRSNAYIHASLPTNVDYKNPKYDSNYAAPAIQVKGDIKLEYSGTIEINDDIPRTVDASTNYYVAPRIQCNNLICEDNSEIRGSDPSYTFNTFINAENKISLTRSRLNYTGGLIGLSASEIELINTTFNINSYLSCFDIKGNKLTIKNDNEDNSTYIANAVGDNKNIIGDYSIINPSIVKCNNELIFDYQFPENYKLLYSNESEGEDREYHEYANIDNLLEGRSLNFHYNRPATPPTLIIEDDTHYAVYDENGLKEGTQISEFDINFDPENGFTIKVLDDITFNHHDNINSSIKSFIKCTFTSLNIVGDKEITFNYIYSNDSFNSISSSFTSIYVSNVDLETTHTSLGPNSLYIGGDPVTNKPINIYFYIQSDIGIPSRPNIISLASFDSQIYYDDALEQDDKESNLFKINNAIINSNSNTLFDLNETNIFIENSKIYDKPIYDTNRGNYRIISSAKDISINKSTLDFEIIEPNENYKYKGIYSAIYSSGGNIEIKNCSKYVIENPNYIKIVNYPISFYGQNISILNSDLNCTNFIGNIFATNEISLDLSENNYVYLTSNNDSTEPLIPSGPRPKEATYKLPCIYSKNNNSESYLFNSYILNNSYASISPLISIFSETDKFNFENINSYHSFSSGHEYVPVPDFCIYDENNVLSYLRGIKISGEDINNLVVHPDDNLYTLELIGDVELNPLNTNGIESSQNVNIKIIGGYKLEINIDVTEDSLDELFGITSNGDLTIGDLNNDDNPEIYINDIYSINNELSSPLKRFVSSLKSNGVTNIYNSSIYGEVSSYLINTYGGLNTSNANLMHNIYANYSINDQINKSKDIISIYSEGDTNIEDNSIIKTQFAPSLNYPNIGYVGIYSINLENNSQTNIEDSDLSFNFILNFDDPNLDNAKTSSAIVAFGNVEIKNSSFKTDNIGSSIVCNNLILNNSNYITNTYTFSILGGNSIKINLTKDNIFKITTHKNGEIDFEEVYPAITTYMEEYDPEKIQITFPDGYTFNTDDFKIEDILKYKNLELILKEKEPDKPIHDDDHHSYQTPKTGIY